MMAKFFTVTFLIVMGFNSIQNEEQNSMDYSLWPRDSHMLQMKVLKATFNQGSKSAEEKDEEASDELVESQTREKIDSGERKMKTNKLKRETAPKDLAVSVSDEAPKTAAKRETALKGNANRLQNLVNLPVQLNVLANVLSKLNTGILDSKSTSPISNSISGDGNTVSSLVNAPVNADAVVNILSSVNKGGAGSSAGQGGLMDGVLGGLLGGGGASGSPLSGLLGGGDNAGPLGGLLGHTLGDLLGALLGGKDLVGKLTGGQDGPAFLKGLLKNLLAGVSKLVDNLLELLVGLLDALVHGVGGMENANDASGATSPAEGAAQNLDMQSIKALIKVLTSLKQQLHEAMKLPAATSKQSNGSSSPLENLLGSSLSSATGSTPPSVSSSGGLLGSILGSSGGSAAGSTSILGNNNAVSSLLNLAPDLNLNLNLLSQVTDVLKGGISEDSLGGISPGTKPNEYCFDIPLNQADTSITGNNNTISNAINIKPKINLDLNLLSSVKEKAHSNAPLQRVCITLPHKNTTVPASTMPTKKPPVTVRPRTVTPPTVRPTNTPFVPSPAASSGEICFYVWVDQTGTVVNGNNNQVYSLLNLPLNLNLDLNLLSNVQPTNLNPPPNLVMRRVCMPGKLPATPAAVQSATEKPRCFRRTCAKWRNFADYNCAYKPLEYPVYAVADDVY